MISQILIFLIFLYFLLTVPDLVGNWSVKHFDKIHPVSCSHNKHTIGVTNPENDKFIIKIEKK